MGWIRKGLVYAGVFVLGMATSYKSCVNSSYAVIEENGKIYVEDKRTGKRADVDDDFDAGKDKSRSRGLGDRVKDAYDSLTR